MSTSTHTASETPAMTLMRVGAHLREGLEGEHDGGKLLNLIWGAKIGTSSAAAVRFLRRGP